MIKAYFNYPGPEVSIHFNENCAQLFKQKHGEKPNKIHISIKNLSEVLLIFKNHLHKFGSTPEDNDMYLLINLGSREFEIAVVNYMKALIEQHYTRFKQVKPEIHNCL